MNEIRAAVAQICPLPGQTEANAENMIFYMKEAAAKGAQLLVFPEASLTGYSTGRAEELAVQEDDPAVQRLRKESDALSLAVCFGYIERREDRLYLTQELYAACKHICYRKTHLGFREKEVFSAGDEFPVLQIPLKVGEESADDPHAEICAGMQLCWEAHIPEISSAEREQGAELFLVPYASGMTGEKTLENWSIHLPARASDNGAFLIACNLLFPGNEESESFRGGGIAVYDPKGKRIAAVSETRPQMLVCDLEGTLPRELPDGDMKNISYFDRKRKELFS